MTQNKKAEEEEIKDNWGNFSNPSYMMGYAFTMSVVGSPVIFLTILTVKLNWLLANDAADGLYGIITSIVKEVLLWFTR